VNLDVNKLRVQDLYLSDTYWDDLRFPVQGINPAGSAAPPTVSNVDGSLEFSASATNIIAGIAQLPHSWKMGTAVEAHIHWCPTNTNTGNVFWRFEYEIQPINGVFVGYGTPVDTLDAGAGVAETHQIHGLAEIDASGITTVSAIIKWKLSRIGGDATDTYNAVARLLELDFHYQIDGFGSQEEYTKTER
jgi:hypothetical protein